MWVLESSIASWWKSTPNFVHSTAWEYYSHSPAKPSPTPTNQLPICNEPVSSTERQVVNHWKRILQLVGHSLMNILFFGITIAISVAKVCCLEDPNIQAYWREPFMACDAADLTGTLFFLHDHPFNFTAAKALTAGGHNYTVSTLTPKVTYYCNTRDYPSRAYKFLPVCTAEPFLVSRVIIVKLCIRL